jgi:tetratricopeptide (TPR) repeat protein
MKRMAHRSTKGSARGDHAKPDAAPQGRRGDSTRTLTATDRIPLAAVLDSAEQSGAFESAIRCFHAGNFVKARELFQQATKGPSREVAHAARLHVRMCDQRIAKPEPTLHTAEEHYNYAIALMNQRKLELAERHLQQALTLAPRGDHLYYALALCRGLSGDLEGAYTHMKRAIELHPRNRATARNDPDFAEIGQRYPLADLLHPERTRGRATALAR